MPDIYGMTAEDVAVLRQIVAERRAASTNLRGRPWVPDQPGPAPDVYVALTPVAGIPAKDAAGTGTGSGVEDIPGSADCEVYQLLSGRLHGVSGLYRTVYNLSSSSIAGSLFVLTLRDKWGDWYVPNGAAGSSTTGGGTGVSGVGDFRQVGTSPYERWYYAGVGNANPVSWSSGGSDTNDLLLAMPFWAPVDCTLAEVGFYATGTSADDSIKVRVGVYANAAAGLYPGALLWDSGEWRPGNFGPGFKSWTPDDGGGDLPLTAGTLYWAAYLPGSDAGSHPGDTLDMGRSNASNFRPCILGYPKQAALAISSASAAALLKSSTAYGALPDPFPAGASVATSTEKFPAFGLRYS